MLCSGAKSCSSRRSWTGTGRRPRKTGAGFGSKSSGWAALGPLLGEPHTRQLHGKLRELRFHLAGRPMRITYCIAPGRRVVLLTLFPKTRRPHQAEVRRAEQALARSRQAGGFDRQEDEAT